jgi:hypothetical protein
MKKPISTFLIISKFLLLLVFGAMSLRGSIMVSMPCADENMQENSHKICFLANEILSKPLIAREKDKNNLNTNKAFNLPLIAKLNFPGKILMKKRIFLKKVFHKNSYLFAKKKIVLII